MKKEVSYEHVYYYKNEMHKEMTIQRLREMGHRITKQREIILSVILEQDYTSCKEMYYKANAIDNSVGMTTIYRLVNVLEEIGVFSRKNLYKISCDIECNKENACMIEFDDGTYCCLPARE